MPEKSKKIQERIQMLLPKYYNLTLEEALEFEEYCRQDPSLRIIKQRLDNEKIVEEHTSHWEPEGTEKRFPVIRQRILAATPQPARKSNTVVRWMVGLAAAAALITTIVRVAPLFRPSGAAQETAVKEVAGVSADDRPALLLAEGYHILLDSLPHGKTWSNQRIRVTRTDNGHIDYAAAKTIFPTGAGRTDQIAYDTLKVPRGRQFSVTLPDGSMVWLNNASSLRFPPAFSGASRDVYLTGEAYFEVEKNTKSFIVHSIQNGKECTVKVLGTHFNISAYPDDPDIRTTLLTGRVLVSRSDKTDILYPGEQLIAGKDGSWDHLKDIQARYIIAWKRDSIYFEGDLPQVMRQITRWYNVEIEVQDFKRAGEFECVLPHGPLPLLLEDLCRNHNAFHFDFQGNKILITR